MSLSIHVARTLEDVEALRAVWATFRYDRVDSDLSFYLEVVKHGPTPSRPHVVVALERDLPRAMFVGRLEETTLPISFGYTTLLRPRVRSITLAHGGVVGDLETHAATLLTSLRRSLEEGEADVLNLPFLRVGTAFQREARLHLSGTRRRSLPGPDLHRRLALPATMDELLRSRSKATRDSVKRYGRRFEREFGDRIGFELVRQVCDLDALMARLETVAGKTYQRGLGVALEDSMLYRRLARLGFERDWFRVYLLTVDDDLVAFWPGWAYERAFFIGTPGYDPAYSDYRVGQYLQMRMLEQLCGDSEVDAVDYGFGDSEYKRRFSSESWEEEDVTVFAPSARGRLLDVGSAAVMRSETLARRVAERTGVAAAVKSRWRRRLRGADKEGSSGS